MNTPGPAKPEPPSETIHPIPSWLRTLVGVPLALLGGLVTFCFGFSLVTYLGSRLTGGRPEPGLFNLLLFWFMFGGPPLAVGILLLRSNPPGKRFWSRSLLALLLLFLVLGADINFGPKNWHAMFRRERLPPERAEELKTTIITPHLEAGIEAGKNVLWCGTFQLAWNEACNLTGGNLRFSQEHPMVSALNLRAFTKDGIDDASYVAIAGFTKDNIHDKIRNAISNKFHGQFKPRFIPDKSLTPRPQDFVAYACLYKLLSFSVPFERLDENLTFGGVKVRAFGFAKHKTSQAQMYPQVLILDYQNEDDFVIEFKTKSDGDRLILAKMQPQAKMGDTIKSVMARSRPVEVKPAAADDILIVPRMKFDLTRKYSEIENQWLLPAGTNIAKDLLLQSAVQNIFFEMNEKGVELKSEAHMGFACAKESPPVLKHRLVFDKRFLVLLQRTNAPMPYFALWLDNPELLIPW